MLSIDKENRKIILQNETVTLVFDLIIGYICPKCSKILRAYWVDDYEEYDPLDFIEPQKDYGERFIFFSGLGGSGFELREHGCNTVYYEFSMQKNLAKFISHLSWSLRNKSDELYNHLLHYSTEQLMIILKGFNARFIFDICEIESPLLIMEEKNIIGNIKDKPYSMYSEIKERKIKNFLKNFELDNYLD